MSPVEVELEGAQEDSTRRSIAVLFMKISLFISGKLGQKKVEHRCHVRVSE